MHPFVCQSLCSGETYYSAHHVWRLASFPKQMIFFTQMPQKVLEGRVKYL